MFLTENIVYLPADIKKENVDYEKLIQDLELQNENMYESLSLNEDRKRMRLHHLTWEEKIQRKKMRNRIAAQTSRDRKKAKMDHLEEAVKDLRQQNYLLLLEIEELKKKNHVLLDANVELQMALDQRSYTCTCLQKVKEDGGIIQSSDKMREQICVEDGYSFERPAESSKAPQQKGPWPASAQVLTKTLSWRLWRIFLLYLLSQKCWQISRETHSLMTLKDWQQVCWQKLSKIRAEEMQNLYSKRFQELASKKALTILKWWGRHQKNWNPLEVM